MIEAQMVREDYECRIPIAEFVLDVEHFIEMAAALGFNHVDFYIYANNDHLLAELIDQCSNAGYMIQIDHLNKDYADIISAKLNKITLTW